MFYTKFWSYKNCVNETLIILYVTTEIGCIFCILYVTTEFGCIFWVYVWLLYEHYFDSPFKLMKFSKP